MVKNPKEYIWSSYRMYISIVPEKTIETLRILSYFKSENRRLYYKEFVESAIKA